MPYFTQHLGFTRRGRGLAALLLAIPIAGPAFAQHGGGQHGMGRPAAASAGSGGMGMGMEMHRSMKSGMDKMMSMHSTGDTDRDFATMMKMHHQMAIDMARLEMDKGKSPELKKMAGQIVEDSQRDIRKIDQWLGQKKP